MRRILITGGTGFVGPHLIRLLKATPSRISVVSSRSTVSSNSDGVEYRTADLRSLPDIRGLVRELQPDEIYHLAGITAVNTAWENPRLTFEVNVVGTYNLFESAMSLPSPPRILYVSTAQVYAPSANRLMETSPMAPDNPYATSKAMAELLGAQYRNYPAGGIIIARAFNHSGPGQSLNFVLPSIAKQFAEIRAGKRSPRLVVGNTDVKRDFSDVRDVARAYCMLVDQGRVGEVYNVCSGTATRLADIIEKFETLAGVKVSLEVDPGRIRSNDVAQICGDPGKLRVTTGWSPQVPLMETLKDLLSAQVSPT